MRVLLAGLVGAAVSAAAWFFLEYNLMREMGWLAIAVGLITGLCIHAAAGAGAAESYGRGALAVLLTMIAIVGGRAAYVEVMQKMSAVTTIAPAEQVANVDNDEDAADEPAAGEDAVEVAAEPQSDDRRAGAAGSTGVVLPKPTVNSYKEMEVVWMALAALAAYVVGKGSGKAGPVEAAEMPAPSENEASTTA